jgi:dTDP-glucose 4,6-dehydratase
MRLLVTGGAGFIGSNLIRHLLLDRNDIEVINLDLLTYAGDLGNLADVVGHINYTFVQGDIADAGLVRDLMNGDATRGHADSRPGIHAGHGEGGRIDAVINMAAESHVDRSISGDAPFVHTNVVGTQVLLAAALECGVGRFLQVSTDEVYGELPWRDPELDPASDPGNAPGPSDCFTESTPLAPRSPYSATKAAADHLALAYHHTHGMDVVVTRCSNNYGPYQHPEKLIPLMITRALADQPLPVYGDGLNVRDWIHVQDHCAGVVAALEHGKPGEVYNFGGDAERKNIQVVKQILAALQKPQELISLVTDRKGHDRRYGVDASKARRELGWVPTRAFEEGLAETVAWYVDRARETPGALSGSSPRK